MGSPPGTSPTPVLPSESVRTTRLRVKNGAWAPERFISIESWPATGMTRMAVTRGDLLRAFMIRSPSESVSGVGGWGAGFGGVYGCGLSDQQDRGGGDGAGGSQGVQAPGDLAGGLFDQTEAVGCDEASEIAQ